MTKGLEYWLIKVLNKEIRQTEMYFILQLEKEFKIKPIRAKKILEGLMSEKIKEVAVFTKYKMPYTLNLFEENGNQKITIHTSNKYFQVEGEIEDIFNFMDKRLKLINQFIELKN